MPRTFNVTNNLGKCLRDSGLTANRFAALTGVNSRIMTEHLAGRIQPLAHEWAAYSEVLGRDVEELMGGQHDPHDPHAMIDAEKQAAWDKIEAAS